MSRREPAHSLALAERLADRAREVVLSFEALNVAVERKSDGSPVTEVDRAVERALRELLAGSAPSDGVHGEEYGGDTAAHEWCWTIDPIDGTRAFAAGLPTFVTLVALLHLGRPVLGVIEQPLVARRWTAAAGVPTRCNGRAVRVRRCAELADAVLGSTGPQFLRQEYRTRFEQLQRSVRDVMWGGDGFLYGALASGGLDLVVEAGLDLHDFAALVPIVEGAGGRMTDWAGRALTAESSGEVVASGDETMHRAALELLARR